MSVTGFYTEDEPVLIFRPISNLQFVSKLIAREAADQLQSHLVKNNLFSSLQSADRANHSTETALLKIKNDILMNMDKQHATRLTIKFS